MYVGNTTAKPVATTRRCNRIARKFFPNLSWPQQYMPKPKLIEVEPETIAIRKLVPHWICHHVGLHQVFLGSSTIGFVHFAACSHAPRQLWPGSLDQHSRFTASPHSKGLAISQAQPCQGHLHPGRFQMRMSNSLVCRDMHRRSYIVIRFKLDHPCIWAQRISRSNSSTLPCMRTISLDLLRTEGHHAWFSLIHRMWAPILPQQYQALPWSLQPAKFTEAPAGFQHGAQVAPQQQPGDTNGQSRLASRRGSVYWRQSSRPLRTSIMRAQVGHNTCVSISQGSFWIICTRCRYYSHTYIYIYIYYRFCTSTICSRFCVAEQNKSQKDKICHAPIRLQM